ncbi:MAG: hypothetical protein ABIO50_04225 [Nitrosospira sp.]
MSYTGERWFKLMADEVMATSQQSVGNRIGKSRTAISLVLSGKYPADTRHVAAKVLAVFDRWHCPYLGADITAQDCFNIYSGPTPSHDPARLAHRRMCRTCIHKQKTGDEA